MRDPRSIIQSGDRGSRKAVKRKRWTSREDFMLFEYYEALGDFIGTHDLGRQPGAADKRVAFLKSCGAWAALQRMRQAEIAYRKCVGFPVDDEAPAFTIVKGADAHEAAQ